MQAWLESKLDHLAVEFLSGSSYGGIFEAQFLAYFECLVALRGKDPTQVWARHTQDCQAVTPDGEQLTCHGNRIADRQELVNTLCRFKQSFETPVKRPPEQPKATQGPLDLFELLE